MLVFTIISDVYDTYGADVSDHMSLPIHRIEDIGAVLSILCVISPAKSLFSF